MVQWEELSAKELELVNQLRQEVAPIVQKHPDLQRFCDAAGGWTYVRYLRARSWNYAKALKMLQATFEWRLETKPAEITWEQVEKEALTGKTFVSPYPDKAGRPVVIMRPRCQNSNDTKMQVLFLIYCLEHAARLADSQRVGKMTWLIDFEGYTMRNAPPVKVSVSVLHLLQNHFPERLGQAVCYHAPSLFSLTWRAVSPFIDPVTHKKICFVNKGAKDEVELMQQHFDLTQVEQCMGGTLPELYSVDSYRERCLAEDADTAAALAAYAAKGSSGASNGHSAGGVSAGSSRSEITAYHDEQR